jgi:hypothetical protein
VDGLAKASILDINGVAVPSAFTPLLDTYTGATAAYSIRQLKTGVTVAMRVRRDTAGGTGDNDEADVDFDTTLTNPTISLDSAVSNFSGTSNATNLGQFLNATGYTDADSLTVVADGFADEWKDQSGNGNHASQATFGSQPQIFDSASPTDLITENGKPALVKQGTAGAFAGPTLSGTVLTVFGVSVVGDAPNRLFQMSGFYMDGEKIFQGSTLSFSSTDVLNQALYSLLFDATDQAFLNGSSVANGDAGTNSAGAITIGGQSATFRVVDSMQEMIFYENNTYAGSTDRTAIETDVNGFFSMY